MEVVPLRLPKPILKRIEMIARRENLDRSGALRKIVYQGLERYVAECYQKGEISLREAAEWMDLPLRETLERLTGLGAAGNVTWEQARKALDEFLARS